MNYIDIAEAAKATGKNQMTIRRLVKKPESKPFIKLDRSEFGDKYTIDVNYLFSKYPPVSPNKKDVQAHDNDNTPLNNQYIQAINDNFQRLINEKEERIRDLKSQLDKKDQQLENKDTIIKSLTETIKLLPPSAEAEIPKKKLSWWKRTFGI